MRHIATWLGGVGSVPRPKDGKVKLDGESVVTFPRLPEFQQLTLKVLRWEERNKTLVIKEAEIVP